MKKLAWDTQRNASRNDLTGTARVVVLALALSPLAGTVFAQPTVNVSASLPSGQPIGTEVAWTATSSSTTVGFRYEQRLDGGPWSLIKDYNPNPSLTWSPLTEGSYDIRVSIYDFGTGETANTMTTFQVEPLVIANTTIISTKHPLVGLYATSECTFPGFISVFYQELGGGTLEQTDWRLCTPGKTDNLYLAGMKEETVYIVIHVTLTGSGLGVGPLRIFATGPLGIEPPARGATPVVAGMSLTENVLLTAPLSVNMPIATDLAGEVLWYYQTPDTLPEDLDTALMRPLPGGTTLVAEADPISELQALREVDFVGNLVRETNLNAMNLQLLGIGVDPINSFHHEAIRLPNGHTAVLGYAERFLVDQQGPGPVAVVGDVIIVMDEDWQVAWLWSAFDHLDTTRQAILDEPCLPTGQAGCLLTIAQTGKDWTHSNSLGYDPSDGNLIVSVRHQDWVIKVDYDDGAGSGQVVWRLGRDGDFTYLSSDPWPEFSHSHDAEFENGVMTIYDNGNTRVITEGGGNSRGQALIVDEVNMTVSFAFNVDLGHYAPFVGSAQQLSNGNYHFNNGALDPGGPQPFSQSLEIQPDQTPIYWQTWQSLAYRSFRMKSLYEP